MSYYDWEESRPHIAALYNEIIKEGMPLFMVSHCQGNFTIYFESLLDINVL